MGDDVDDDDMEQKNKEYDGLNRAYSYYSNHDRFDYNEYNNATRKESKLHKNQNKKNKCFLIADLSNIACSLSIIECIQKRHSDIVKVHFISGNINCGIWRMINSFSLHVIESFIDGYIQYSKEHRAQIKLSQKDDVNSRECDKYKYKNDDAV